MLPLLGVVCLVGSKLAGPRVRTAERFFVATLMLATFACFRTMLAGETLWLVHAVTMALMIVGSVSIPSAQPSRAAGSGLEDYELEHCSLTAAR